jgi:hypothetical protein
MGNGRGLVMKATYAVAVAIESARKNAGKIPRIGRTRPVAENDTARIPA